MDRFTARWKVWLAANESNRRGALCMIVFILLGTGLFGFKGILVIAGLCMMAEGCAMLMTLSQPGH